MPDTAIASAPASIGNVGVGFDVLGLAFDAARDRVTAVREDAPGVRLGVVSGLMASLPDRPETNTALAAAQAMLDATGATFGVRLSIEKGVPLSAGMGGSAASAVLFNCSRPEVMRQAVETAAAVLAQSGRSVEIGVYANAFTPEEEGAANEALHGIREDLSGDHYARFACDWADSGATMIGGCCGVGASHIHHLRQRLT